MESSRLSSYRCIYGCDFMVEECSISRAYRDKNHRNCIARIIKTLAFYYVDFLAGMNTKPIRYYLLPILKLR